MAHIADLMVDTRSRAGPNNHKARGISPNPPPEGPPPTSIPADEKDVYVWRMHQPSESRKYQLFPAADKLLITVGRTNPDPEAMGQGEKGTSTAGATRPKPKEPSLIRRRKVSVPELGPMTTVQEVAMDSPTIPGRPPLHERSVSAPGNSWRKHVFGESMLSLLSGPSLDENVEISLADENNIAEWASQHAARSNTPKPRSVSPKRPLSPKVLAPLVIPPTLSPPQRLNAPNSTTRPRSDSIPPEVPPKSPRVKEGSPLPRIAPFSPISASSLYSASTTSTSVLNTPTSGLEGRASPCLSSGGPSPSLHTVGHSREPLETSSRQTTAVGHRRGNSDASIMDRGRPKKRFEGSPLKTKVTKQISPTTEEQKAYETLPPGCLAADAPSLLPATEIEALRNQALGQASRFEVLGSKDVEALSRELRGLDERCEYLRKTHRSLRSGRRNLHDRICSYLRSPRVARFSHESILRQEESLAELDASIDDWVSKLEEAENRRTRVRQKLLEHVAAALILPPPKPDGETTSNHVVETKVRTALTGENTPPGSPPKAHSPPRLAAPVQVDGPEVVGHRKVESIRIYADSDVYALLADVEEEINRMGEEAQRSEPSEPNQTGIQAAMDAGMILNSATFSPPPKPLGHSTPCQLS